MPDNVAFALRDWQRVQRKITLYTDGALLQFPDPDRLDVLAETLAQLDSEGREGVRAGLRELYLPGTGDWALSRVLDMAELHTIDYNSDPPPCFRPAEGLVLEVLPTGLDMVTRAEIEQIATLDDEGRWALSPKRLRSRWPADPAGALLDFLGPRIDGGPNPDLVLKVRAQIDGADAEVVEGATVVILSDETATERLLEIHGVAEWIEMRLGPAALLVAPGRAAAVTALLVKLGLTEED